MGNCVSSGAARTLNQQKKQVPDSIVSLFESYAGKTSVLSVQDLQQVLVDQRINNSEAHARQLIVKYQKEALENGGPTRTAGEGSLELDLAGFASLLLDADVNGLHDAGNVTNDMNQPLSHYYIQTAQAASGSGVGAILEALKMGARVVDLEVYPDGENIRVTFGGSTAPVVDVLRAVKEGAFVASDFPVILVLENHLPLPLQELLAQYLRDILGEALFVPPSNAAGQPLLSPNVLKRRFVLAEGKPSSAAANGAKEASPPASTPTSVLPGGKELIESDDPAANGAPNLSNAADTGSFSSLVYIPGLKATEPIHFANKIGTLASLSEAAFTKMADTTPSVLATYAKNNLVRVYPSGSQPDSPSSDPTKAWSYGAQIVASNVQANARHLWLQQGLFLSNGGCGYVKKPDLFYAAPVVAPGVGASASGAFDPSVKQPVKTTLKIMVIWSRANQKQSDLARRPDSFVRIASYGVPADQEVYDTTTRVDNKKPAAWEAEEFHFPLTAPELALLAIEVREYNAQQQDNVASQICLPVSELKPGLRAVVMKDAAGNPSQGGQAKLLVHVELSRSDEGPRPADGNRPAGAVPPLVANSPGANSATPAGNPPPPQVVHHETRYRETIVHERRRPALGGFLGGFVVGRMLMPRRRQQVVVVNNKTPAPQRNIKNNTVVINKGSQAYKSPGYSKAPNAKPGGAAYGGAAYNRSARAPSARPGPAAYSRPKVAQAARPRVAQGARGMRRRR